MTNTWKPRRRDLLKAGALPALATPALAAPLRVVLKNARTEAPVARALGLLRDALTAEGALVADTGDFVVTVRNEDRAGPEQFRLVPGKAGLVVSASDVRGAVYALTELAERVRFGGPLALKLTKAEHAAPANAVRSVARSFCSEIEDKPWYYDNGFWTDYLDVLAAARFNRFNFFYGIAYDFPRGVTDDYSHFPYPYLLDVPGYDVRAEPLAPGEREKNLAALQYIARETVTRGLDFQLGIWTHAYAWTDSPNSAHHIVGLTPQTHAVYCRDALALLLKSVPEISGLTLRVHGESGIPEGSYDFWTTLFDAIKQAGRPVEIDMHAKGTSQTIIDIAAATGQKVKLGPKYSAEHQSLGYHQADIRAQEIPKPGPAADATFALSNGDRSFTRYGYGDLYQQGRQYDILYRLWPGTQHHLLWADPSQAAAFGRTASFCGAAGLEIMEPLTFKGREGSGHGDGRCAYLDKALDPGVQDFRKFLPGLRVWGRMLYNPQDTPDAWRRDFKALYGADYLAAETALANASRILPLMTSAHLPSASNHDLQYEMAANMPIVSDGDVPYTDTAQPRVYGHASPLDPQLFSRIDEHVADLLAGHVRGKYAPDEVCTWLEACVAASQAALAKLKGRSDPQTRRLVEDLAIVNGMGIFYAAKLRAAMLFEIWKAGGGQSVGEQALAIYAKGRGAWAVMADRAAKVYVADVSYGRVAKRRGHWQDRLTGIDKDLAMMRVALTNPVVPPLAEDIVESAVARVTGRVRRNKAVTRHTVPRAFHPGVELALALTASGVEKANLYYRHVNHGERWQLVAMTGHGGAFQAAIPAAYTASPYPLQYYFELIRGGSVWLEPAFNATLSNQPYHAVWRRA